jgi:hypothetical protein
MELLDVVEIYNRIAMHSEETIRIEQRLEVFHASPKQMRRFANMQSNVIPVRLHPSDILDLNHHNLFIRLNSKSLQETRQGLLLFLASRSGSILKVHSATSNFRSCEIQSGFEALRIKWLYEEVDCAGRELRH